VPKRGTPTGRVFQSDMSQNYPELKLLEIKYTIDRIASYAAE